MSSNSLLAGLGGLALAAGGASADVIISEIVDGPLPGGLPKFVELTNTGTADVDLSTISIGNYNNGGTDLGGSISTQLSSVLAPGGTYVVSYENSDGPGVGFFFDVYGVDPSNFDLGAFINGDDVVAIFATDGTGPNGEATGDGSDATMLDVYGEIGVDGSGEVWEYTDGGSKRCADTANGGVWTPDGWQYLGADGLEAGCGGDDVCETVNLQTMTFPFVWPDCDYTVAAYCFGDGTGEACPCGNVGGAGEGCANGTGTGALLATTGTASLSADSLVLGVTGVPNSFGLFFQGDARIDPAVSFGDGLQCCGGNMVRVGTYLASGNATDTATGNLTGGFGPPITTLPGNLIAPGATRCYQYWYRDSAGPCSGGFNTSNGVELAWAP